MADMVEVWYGGKREAKDPLYKLPLTPGVNRVEADRAELLLLRQVVTEVEGRRVSRTEE